MQQYALNKGLNIVIRLTYVILRGKISLTIIKGEAYEINRKLDYNRSI